MTAQGRLALARGPQQICRAEQTALHPTHQLSLALLAHSMALMFPTHPQHLLRLRQSHRALRSMSSLFGATTSSQLMTVWPCIWLHIAACASLHARHCMHRLRGQLYACMFSLSGRVSCLRAVKTSSAWTFMSKSSSGWLVMDQCDSTGIRWLFCRMLSQ